MKAYSPAAMKEADSYCINKLGIPGPVLMKNAAQALFSSLDDFIGKAGKFTILCGSGNNGGDGYALGLMLHKCFENVVCLCLSGKEPKTEDALYFYKECIKNNVPVIDCLCDFDNAKDRISASNVIVDAIFGTGFSGNIENGSTFALAIKEANSTSAFKISADVPSGICADSGEVSEISFRADVTVSFAKPKIGMYSYPAREFCGEIVVADIGFPERVFENIPTKYEISDIDTAREFLPVRYPNSNKGSYGRLLIVAGSENMPGAAYLACLGALRCGTGLVCLAGNKKTTDVIKNRLSEPIYLNLTGEESDMEKLTEYAKVCSAVLCGCGLGKNNHTFEIVSSLIKNSNVPIILDADGINVISDNINVLSEAKCDIVLTPHPMEFSRLTGKNVPEIQSRRIRYAREFSKEYNCTLVLKGACTVICEKGEKLCVNTSGSSALSKAGSGDVLSGMLAAFIAQGKGVYESSVLATYLHGCAGDSLSKELSEYGVLPSEIPERAARIIAKIKG